MCLIMDQRTRFLHTHIPNNDCKNKTSLYWPPSASLILICIKTKSHIENWLFMSGFSSIDIESSFHLLQCWTMRLIRFSRDIDIQMWADEFLQLIICIFIQHQSSAVFIRCHPRCDIWIVFTYNYFNGVKFWIEAAHSRICGRTVFVLLMEFVGQWIYKFKSCLINQLMNITDALRFIEPTGTDLTSGNRIKLFYFSLQFLS